jgi:hypothetical protein
MKVKLVNKILDLIISETKLIVSLLYLHSSVVPHEQFVDCCSIWNHDGK